MTMFCDEPIPVTVGEDGLSQSDWDLIFSSVRDRVAGIKQKTERGPSISARQAYANAQAAEQRIMKVWRKKMGYT